jgi:hypothetical protein
MVKKTTMIDEGDEGWIDETSMKEMKEMERRFGEEGWIGEERWILGFNNPKILPLSLSSLLTCHLFSQFIFFYFKFSKIHVATHLSNLSATWALTQSKLTGATELQKGVKLGGWKVIFFNRGPKSLLFKT